MIKKLYLFNLYLFPLFRDYKNKARLRQNKYKSTPEGKRVYAESNFRYQSKRKYGVSKERCNEVLKTGCDDCGFNQYVLDWHNLDKNRKNDNPDNLKYLCPNCHAKHHRVNLNGKYIS
jgi:hypothetical protein